MPLNNQKNTQITVLFETLDYGVTAVYKYLDANKGLKVRDAESDTATTPLHLEVEAKKVRDILRDKDEKTILLLCTRVASLCELASDDAAENRKDHQKAAKLLDVGVDVCTQAEKECHKRALYDKENDFRDKRLDYLPKKHS